MMRLTAICFVLALVVGSSLQFTTQPTTLGPAYDTCQDFLDLVLVIDASQSVQGNFEDMKNAARNLVNTIADNNPNIFIGLVFYSNTAAIFQDGSGRRLTGDRNALLNFIDNTAGGIGETNTHLGIRAAVSILDGRASIGRDGNPGNIIVVTDAISAQPTETIAAATEALSRPYVMFAIGVAVDLAYRQELNRMVRDYAKIFPLEDTSQTPQMVESLAKSICAYTVCSSCIADEGTRHAPHLTRCDKFYTCSRRKSDQHLIAREMTCPYKTLWNRRHATCDHISNVIGNPDAGCAYCTTANTLPAYPMADRCQMYYTCSGNNLEMNCCPNGQRFNPATGQCQTGATACPEQRYKARGCMEYSFCDSTTNQFQEACCGAGSNFFDVDNQVCRADPYCMGTCQDSRYKHYCAFVSANTNPCKYNIRSGNKTESRDCPNGQSFNPTTCDCEVDEQRCTTPRAAAACRPDYWLTFDNVQDRQAISFDNRIGKRRWVEARRVEYPLLTDGSGGVMETFDGFLVLLYYSQNNFDSNTFFVRLSFRRLNTNNIQSNQEMYLISNQPCAQDFQETAGDESVWVKVIPNQATVEFGVRTKSSTDVISRRTIDVPYNPTQPADIWNEVSFKYSANPGLLEGSVRSYNFDSTGGKVYLGNASVQRSILIPGVILTSSCGLKIGKKQGTSEHHVGQIDDVIIFDACTKENEIPDVDQPYTPTLPN